MKGILQLALLPALLGGPVAWAWGPGTHLYIMDLVEPQAGAMAQYGAMLPDCNATILDDPEVNRAVKRLLHDDFGLLPASALRTGLATHNSLWGADYYAHLVYHPEDPESATAYATQKIEALVSEFGITTSQAEDVLELTIDYLLRIDLGPGFGVRIERAATQVGTAAEDQLVATYTAPLMARVPRLTEAEAERYIRHAAQTFRGVTTFYGQQLQQADDAFIEATIPVLLATYLGTGISTARTYFERAVELCRDDYADALNDIAVRIDAHMDGLDGYSLPATGPALLGVLVFAIMASSVYRGGLGLRADTRRIPAPPAQRTRVTCAPGGD